MRVHELSKELGIDSKELIERLKKLGAVVKSHMSSIDSDTVALIKAEIKNLQEKTIEQNVIEVDFPITVKDLSLKLNKKPSELLQYFLKQGKFYNINQGVDAETAVKIAYEHKINLRQKPTAEELILKSTSFKKDKRPPIVTFMGHIDHGKTSLLDYIRKTKIAEKESGGITQHIGAYQVQLPKGKITFLDTPGHVTFTAMRARGACVTDIVVLVVDAEEGIKPQTLEAIAHARAANVPIIVAINKIDRPNANPDMVKQQLSKQELTPEDWGGKTITVGVSAKTGRHIDELLDLILLQAEIMELTADYQRSAIGAVVEARLSKGKGPVVTILVQQGQLKTGGWCVCGTACGKLKAMYDDLGRVIDSAGPACPVEITGLDGVPNPGDQLFAVSGEQDARQIVEKRREEEKRKKQFAPAHMNLEELYKKIKEGEAKQLRVILKADVGGTLEAVETALKQIESPEVELIISHKSVGSINSSDVLLAEVIDAIIIGFKITADGQTRDLAKNKGIEIRIYQIVYELIDDVKAALEGMLTPQVKKVFLGRARIKNVFKLTKGVIAGCIVEKGKIVRNGLCHLFRGQDLIFEGKIVSLKRFKDDVKEAAEGHECGISVGYDSIQANDIIDVFSEELVSRRL